MITCQRKYHPNVLQQDCLPFFHPKTGYLPIKFRIKRLINTESKISHLAIQVHRYSPTCCLSFLSQRQLHMMYYWVNFIIYFFFHLILVKKPPAWCITHMGTSYSNHFQLPWFQDFSLKCIWKDCLPVLVSPFAWQRSDPKSLHESGSPWGKLQ